MRTSTAALVAKRIAEAAWFWPLLILTRAAEMLARASYNLNLTWRTA